jgi:hypothetical protein
MGYTERDSAKDEAVVLIFIFATVGLLLYAAFRPWVDQWITVSGAIELIVRLS